MELYLAMQTAGKYGGGPKGDLRHFSHLIQASLNNAGFKSSFTEFWLTLSYPPMFVLPGVVGIEIDYKGHYDKLPNLRLNRKYKKIDIALKAPEFSENQDKTEQDKYEHRFDIEDRYKNIPDDELAKILVYKYLEAGQLIKSKLNTGDIFDFHIYENTLAALRAQITPEFVISTAAMLNDEIKGKTIKQTVDAREQRKLANKPKDKLIRDLRVYDYGFPKKAFYPYAYQYSEIFLNLLRRKKLMCPTYHHLYIGIANNTDDCLEHFFAYDTWQEFGLATINYTDYRYKTEPQKEQIVFEAMISGLNDLANIDKLDLSVINDTIEEIKLKGLDTELEFSVVENKKYKLVISYLSKSMEEKCPIYLNLIEKISGKANRIQIGRADNSQIYFWFQKVALNNDVIKIKSSTSIAADVSLKDMPRNMEFKIQDILNG
ncbi:MAG: hypothetical protein V4592_07545 [Bacteroidota bacterium]